MGRGQDGRYANGVGKPIICGLDETDGRVEDYDPRLVGRDKCRQL